MRLSLKSELDIVASISRNPKRWCPWVELWNETGSRQKYKAAQGHTADAFSALLAKLGSPPCPIENRSR